MRAGAYLTGMFASLLIHLCAVVCLGLLIRGVDAQTVQPVFSIGLSSVELDFVVLNPSVPALVPEQDIVPEQELEKETVESEVEQPKDPVDLDQGVQDQAHNLSTDERPRYPLGSRIRGEEGTVTLRVLIDAAGRVSSVELVESSGYVSLDKAGIKAATSAGFVDEHGRIAVSAETTISFKFLLTD